MDRRRPAVEDQAQTRVGEQAGGGRPVLGRLVLPDRLHDCAVLLQPLGGGSVQRHDQRWMTPPELEAQEVGEQVVIAKPRTPDVECRHERVGVLELLEHPLRSRAARHVIGQRAADALEHRCAQQQVAHLRRLALEHLGQQIARDRALAAGELGHELLGIRMLGERDRGHSQPGGPPLGALVQQRHACVRERDSGRFQQFARLPQREAERRRTELDQATDEAEAMQAEPGIRACDQHGPHLCRQASQEPFERCQRVGRLQPVQIVDHQHRRLLERLEILEQALDHERALEAGRRAHPCHELARPRQAGERIDDRHPEPLTIALTAVDRDPRRPTSESLALQPGARQHRLAAARRPAHDHHAARRNRRQPLEQRPPLDHRVARK